MIIGVPKEVLNNEGRVSITPSGVYELISNGHEVYIEYNAGQLSGFSDEEYQKLGAVVTSKDEVFKHSELIVKVKEFTEEEFCYLREDQVVFTYLHLASNPTFASNLIEHKVTSIAYETVTSNSGTLPLLTPMSEVAGRMSVQIGANMLLKANGGKGVLLGGVPGVMSANVVIVGGGVVGFNAARIASGLGANVKVFEVNFNRMQYIDDISNGTIHTIYNTKHNLCEALKDCDLLIGAVLVPGAKAPKLITEDMVKQMKPGSAIVDVAIDQGGTIETIDHTTSHDDPYFVKHGILHYSVPNMPGAVPYTSTIALSNATLPYIIKLANSNFEILKEDLNFRNGINTYKGHITNKAVSEALDLPYKSIDELL